MAIDEREVGPGVGTCRILGLEIVDDVFGPTIASLEQKAKGLANELSLAVLKGDRLSIHKELN
jgi:hypothetical protein